MDLISPQQLFCFSLLDDQDILSCEVEMVCGSLYHRVTSSSTLVCVIMAMYNSTGVCVIVPYGLSTTLIWGIVLLLRIVWLVRANISVKHVRLCPA
jgi:hypothetical protein